MSEPVKCPNCEAKVAPHCHNESCSLAVCPGCGFYGIPEEDIWRRPVVARESK